MSDEEKFAAELKAHRMRLVVDKLARAEDRPPLLVFRIGDRSTVLQRLHSAAAGLQWLKERGT